MKKNSVLRQVPSTDRYLNFDAADLRRRNSYWTAREICQQPRVWRDAYGLVDRSRGAINSWLAPILLTPNPRILLCGAGTSAFVGDTAAAWLRKECRTPFGASFAAVSTTGLTADPAQYLSHDVPTLMISFARSGDSPESLSCVRLANELLSECRHLVLTCNPKGRLARWAGADENAMCVMMPEDADDRGFAMTSSYSSLLVSCLAIFTPDSPQMEQAAKLGQHVIDSCGEHVGELAQRDFRRLAVLGAGCLSGTAGEAALKCMELTGGRIVAIHETPLGFRHGPKIMADESTMVLHLRSNDPYISRYDRDLLRELRDDDRSAAVVELSPASLAVDIGTVAVAAWLDDAWLSLAYMVFCQMLAFQKAMVLGIEADNPCPTGEVNRVVSGVSIYPFGGRSSLSRSSNG